MACAVLRIVTSRSEEAGGGCRSGVARSIAAVGAARAATLAPMNPRRDGRFEFFMDLPGCDLGSSLGASEIVSFSEARGLDRGLAIVFPHG